MQYMYNLNPLLEIRISRFVPHPNPLVRLMPRPCPIQITGKAARAQDFPLPSNPSPFPHTPVTSITLLGMHAKSCNNTWSSLINTIIATSITYVTGGNCLLRQQLFIINWHGEKSLTQHSGNNWAPLRQGTIIGTHAVREAVLRQVYRLDPRYMVNVHLTHI